MEQNQVATPTKHVVLKQLSSAEITRFFEQMAVFSKGGISTWESLLILSENTADDKTKRLVDALFEDVSDGMFFSESMELCGCFPTYAIGMVELGEQTGRLEEVSAALAEYYRNKDRLSQSVRTAVAYPLGISAMVFVVIFVLLVQVMPVFEQVFSQLGLALNPMSTFLLELGQGLSTYSGIFAIVFAVLVLAYVMLKLTTGGKKVLSNLYVNLPFTRRISEAENANRFAFSMSLMLGSGVDALNALEFALFIADGEKTRAKIRAAITAVESGVSLGDAIVNSDLFKPMYNGMLIAGIRSGAMEETFMAISERYYEETENYTQKLLGIIEPALVGLLCLIVGMVMLSVMLPLAGILAGM